MVYTQINDKGEMMGRWHSFGSKSKPAKSLTELQAEIEKLKKAKEAIKNYDALQEEEKRIKQEIKQEGFKLKHKRALSILNTASIVAHGIAKDAEKIVKKEMKKK
jgi:prophage DNA circulation protein